MSWTTGQQERPWMRCSTTRLSSSSTTSSSRHATPAVLLAEQFLVSLRFYFLLGIKSHQSNVQAGLTKVSAWLAFTCECADCNESKSATRVPYIADKRSDRASAKPLHMYQMTQTKQSSVHPLQVKCNAYLVGYQSFRALICAIFCSLLLRGSYVNALQVDEDRKHWWATRRATSLGHAKEYHNTRDCVDDL